MVVYAGWKYPVETTHDFFTLGINPERVGVDLSYSAAYLLLQTFQNEPPYMLCARLRGWDYPVTRHDAVTRDLVDLIANAVQKNPKQYPRPWMSDVRTSRAPAISQQEVLDLLARVGPTD